ncbi:MAG: bifunctional diaminohydroxyphosphoribosylaminopyrimidine deaminase/5-amino-6-(5-phosphoribosylamino)uracil reductase RibD [Ignavibacteria bacterium]|nr:bifunctional diaminohydroxyphosphoribosylaminopyrimidine deaminase/5-amino-6-(5-phosphoribosylamino)uracil reductase RibD [Ignavibacteria bacterium]
MTNDEDIMQKCIQLSLKGKGHVSPNPLVGCIIIKDGKVIGKGFHSKFGEEHAEANAVNDAKSNGYDLRNSEVYVNLEPCSHTGKTNPCSDLLINEKVGKVIVGMKDPFEKVNGKGIKKLRNAGIEVVTGVLESECKELNKFFIKFVKEHLPYVTLKIAQSIDGRIALSNYKSQWITGKESRKFVHQLRSEYDVVLIGKNTARYDNPSLTVREVHGRTPYRIVIDRDSTLPGNLKLFTDTEKDKTFVVTGSSKKAVTEIYSRNIIRVKEKDQKLIIKDILKKLYAMNVSSVLVEGGANLYSQFVKSDLFDDIYVFIAPKIIGKGISCFSDYEITKLTDAKILNYIYSKSFDKDLLIYYKNVHRNSTGSGKDH